MGRLKALAKSVQSVNAMKEAGVTKSRALRAINIFQRDVQHMALTREHRKHTTVLLLTACLGGLLQAGASEMRVDDMDASMINLAKGTVSISTLCLLYMIWKDYKIQLLLAQLHGHAHDRDTIWTLDWGTKFVAELVVCALHCPPWVEFSIPVRDRSAPTDVIEYHFDNVAAVLVSLRVYLAFRLISVHLSYSSTEARSIGIRNRVALNGEFTFNVLANDHPFVLSLSLMTLALLVLSNALRVAEQPVNDEFFYFWDSVWCAVVTMTTVGYGDIVPITFAGRFTAFATCIVGVGVVAMFALSVTNLTTLTPSQIKVKHLLNKSQVRRQHVDAAVRLIQSQWRLYYAQYEDPLASHTTLKILLTRRLRVWRDAKRFWFQVQRDDEQYAMSVHESLAQSERGVSERMQALEETQRSLLQMVVKFTSDPSHSLTSRVEALEAEIRICRDMLREFPTMSLHAGAPGLPQGAGGTRRVPGGVSPKSFGGGGLSLRPNAMKVQASYSSSAASSLAGAPQTSSDDDDDDDHDHDHGDLTQFARGARSARARQKQKKMASPSSALSSALSDPLPPEGGVSPQKPKASVLSEFPFAGSEAALLSPSPTPSASASAPAVRRNQSASPSSSSSSSSAEKEKEARAAAEAKREREARAAAEAKREREARAAAEAEEARARARAREAKEAEEARARTEAKEEEDSEDEGGDDGFAAMAPLPMPSGRGGPPVGSGRARRSTQIRK